MSADPPPSKRTSFQTLPDDDSDSASGIDESERSGPESGRWYTPTDHEEDNAPPKIRAERLRSLRQFRKYTIGYFEYWNRPAGFIIYITYMVFAILVAVVAQIDQESNKGEENYMGYYITIQVVYCIWLIVLVFAELPPAIFGRRQILAWCGLYIELLGALLVAGTITSIYFSFIYDNFQFERLTLVLMAFAVYVMERIREPRYRQFYWVYKGCISVGDLGKQPPITGVGISAGDLGKQPPITGVGTNALMKLVINASKAMGISDEALQTIEKKLEGSKIRQDEEEALDDWTVIIYKLSKVVSILPPLPFCRSKSTISPTEYRNLVCQLIIYIRMYMETGKIERNESHLNRTAPLSFGETLVQMTKFSWQVPGRFLLALLPRSLQTIANTAVLPFANRWFFNGIYTQDRDLAIRGLAIALSMHVATPIFGVLANVAESSFTSSMVDQCRIKMFTRLTKGGTQYDQKNRRGTIIDGFSNNLTQLLIFAQTFYITIFPMLAGIIGGVIISGLMYPFAVVLFFSIVPIILSVDHFLRKASEAADGKAKCEGKVTGKVTSAVDCRKAIRAANAGTWVNNDMKGLFEQLRVNTRIAWFRSDLARNFLEFGAAFFMVLVVIPLGIEVINGQRTPGDFIGVATSLAALIMPLNFLGQAQSNTMIYSASVQSVKNLMDSKLDEEPPSKSSEPKKTLVPLSNSIKVGSVKFRYQPTSPDVLKGVDLDIGQGTYVVMCGESGSGKSTVLGLLMRFNKPREGVIEWDGNDICNTTLDSFREQVGVMFQQTMIYQATIRDNILFGLPEVLGEVEKAAEAAEIADVINRLPDGYDTLIGGDSITGMSGGQLQRVCMARALYRKPSVLLLDEATSALDKETSQAIIETLVNLRDNEGLTLVSVSHHPETALEANKIVVLAQGIVAEEGTYDELASREGGIFRRIVEVGE